MRPTTITDGRCDRCSEVETACGCPATSVAVREDFRNQAHVQLRVFVGVSPQRGLAGSLVLRVEEWDELRRQPEMPSGWMLLPIQVLDS